MIARHYLVRGRVQGVAFRWSTRATAQRLGVAGWVRNLPDGTVEAWAESDPARIEALTAWIRQGPTGARVASVVVDEAVPVGLESFEIRS